MTTILEDIRRLDAARKRGDISPDVYEHEKRRVLGRVEDVQLVSETRPERRNPHRAREDENQGLWSLLLVGFCLAGILTFVAAQLIGDMTIAVTLVVTIFAAILVKAAKRLEH